MLAGRLPQTWRTRAISLKAISFGLIGVVNTAVDYGVFLVARAAYAHLPPALALSGWVAEACACGSSGTILLIGANITSWLIAVTGSYIMNSSITFAAKSGRQLPLACLLCFRRLRHCRPDRQHRCAGLPRADPAGADLDGQGGRYSGQLHRQFFALTFRHLPQQRLIA